MEVAPVSLGLVLLSFCSLFILAIALALCTECRRYSFHMQERPRKERTPSTMIRVVNLEQVRESPWINNITKDEEGDSSEPMKTVNGNTKERRGDKFPSAEINSGEISVIPNEEQHSEPQSTLSRDGTRTAAEGPASITARQTDMASVSIFTPHMDVETPLQSTPSQNLTQIQSKGFGSSVQSCEDHETRSPQNPSKPQRMYESIGDLCEANVNLYPATGAFVKDCFEDPSHQAVEEVTPDSSPASHVSNLQHGGDPALSVPPTPTEMVREGVYGRGLNDMYARVSKKAKSPTPQPQLPKEEREEQVEPPPPIPHRGSEESFITIELV
ncbi:uncharacterized protein LOC108921673 isoform X2 [Scleropages formosus]|nr:uncharacterized protein LOC108921673 isoform X2 [Scleropages formosus]